MGISHHNNVPSRRRRRGGKRREGGERSCGLHHLGLLYLREYFRTQQSKNERVVRCVRECGHDEHPALTPSAKQSYSKGALYKEHRAQCNLLVVLW